MQKPHTSRRILMKMTQKQAQEQSCRLETH